MAKVEKLTRKQKELLLDWIDVLRVEGNSIADIINIMAAGMALVAGMSMLITVLDGMDKKEKKTEVPQVWLDAFKEKGK
jgi:hypothetical protein